MLSCFTYCVSHCLSLYMFVSLLLLFYLMALPFHMRFDLLTWDPGNVWIGASFSCPGGTTRYKSGAAEAEGSPATPEPGTRKCVYWRALVGVRWGWLLTGTALIAIPCRSGRGRCGKNYLRMKMFFSPVDLLGVATAPVGGWKKYVLIKSVLIPFMIL